MGLLLIDEFGRNCCLRCLIEVIWNHTCVDDLVEFSMEYDELWLCLNKLAIYLLSMINLFLHDLTMSNEFV